MEIRLVHETYLTYLSVHVFSSVQEQIAIVNVANALVEVALTNSATRVVSKVTERLFVTTVLKGIREINVRNARTDILETQSKRAAFVRSVTAMETSIRLPTESAIQRQAFVIIVLTMPPETNAKDANLDTSETQKLNHVEVFH